MGANNFDLLNKNFQSINEANISDTSATTPSLNLHLPELFAVGNALKMNVMQSGSDEYRVSESQFNYDSELTQYSNTFSSAEISDQNERVLKELDKVKLTKIMKTFTSNKPNQDSLEQNYCDQNIGKSPSIIFNMENSCNASDNKIANRSSAKKYDRNLSFKLDIDNNRKNSVSSSSINMNMISARRTPVKRREQSPDLFEDFLESDEDTCKAADENEASIVNEKANNTNGWEKTLLKRLQASLSGVLPPPSKTIVQYSSTELLNLYNENLIKMSECKENDLHDIESLFKPTHTVEEVKNFGWNDIKSGIKCHGLLYNRTTDSEDIELLCMKYAERCVGVETSSSFTYTYRPSANKIRMKLLSQSPGTRLSHLVGRKRGLSSASLMSKQCGSDSSKLGSRQMVIDVQ